MHKDAAGIAAEDPTKNRVAEVKGEHELQKMYRQLPTYVAPHWGRVISITVPDDRIDK